MPSAPTPSVFSPIQFEKMVLDHLTARTPYLGLYKVLPHSRVTGPEGEFKIDLLFKFRFAGVAYVTIIECKTNGRPLDRDCVQVLADKVRSLGAHKGILYATAGFQRGAIEYAEARGVGLMQFKGGKFETVVSGDGAGEYGFGKN